VTFGYLWTLLVVCVEPLILGHAYDEYMVLAKLGMTTLQGIKPDSMTHTGQEGTTSGYSHDVMKELGRVLPHPSVVIHAYASMDTPWVARTLSHCTPVKWGKVLSNSMTHEATKFAGPHKSLMRQYIIKCLFIRAQLMRALIDTGRGYHLGALNLWSRPLSTFPSSILHFPLIAPFGLTLNHCINYSSSQQSIRLPGYKRP
jgi:hypothetical protein